MADSQPIAQPDDPAPAPALSRCFDAVYGLEILAEELPGGPLRARVPVAGLGDSVDRGVIVAVAEALASRGTYSAGSCAVGLSNELTYVSPLVGGHLNATAVPRDVSDDRWLWDVEARDDGGQLCAVTEVTVAVRAGGR